MSSQKVRLITAAIQRLYPKELADSSWDNTGLLLSGLPEEVKLDSDPKINVLLTIDLTRSVVDEAITNKSSYIMAYHPFIFSGLKSINAQNSQQNSLLRLIKEGISVYCPHTAIDAAVGGVNDWLADGVSGGSEYEASRTILKPTENVVQGFEGAGMGRLIQLRTSIRFSDLVLRVKNHLGLTQLQVALAPNHRDQPVKSIAMCAGSGGSVFRGVKADVYLTGELGHHECLNMIENGSSAIICGHSNTERGFLKTFKQQLEGELNKDVEHAEHVEVIVSETDKDPLEIV